MNLYDGDYINIEYCLSFGCPFTLVIGGRGTGKTFGALRYALQHHIQFILLRRTQSQADLIGKTEFSPMEPVVRFMGLSQKTKPISKYNAAIRIIQPDADENDPGEMAGWTAALSTFSNLRGFDASGIDLIIYDECIPETHERPMRNEGDAMLNVYETVNRNRELQGRPPVQMLLLSNANRLDSPVLEALDLIPVLEKMLKSGKQEYIDRQRGVALFLPAASVSARKADTALYRAIRGSGSFSDMSLGNKFAYDDMTDVKPQNLAGWRLRIRLGDLYIYDQGSRWYVSAHCAGTPAKQYNNTETDLRRFIRDHPSAYTRFIEHRILFEDYSCRIRFSDLFD